MTIDVAKVPREVLDIIKKLDEAGYGAYLAGGAVRDLLLNRPPKDYDIATIAAPTQVMVLFPEAKPTGLEYGTVSIPVYSDMKDVEVTTYRTESEYADGRRPKVVKFGASLREDAERRDSTINAMYWHPEVGVVDFFGGLLHLQHRVITPVGEGLVRIEEDAIRPLRYIRQAIELGFKFSPLMHLAMAVSAKESAFRLVPEHFQMEFNKMLLTDNPSRAIRLLWKYDFLQHFLPEIAALRGFDQHNPHHDKDVYEHTMKVLDSTPARLNVRLAALFHDVGKPKSFSLDEEGKGHFYGHHLDGEVITREVLTRLRYSNDIIDDVSKLVREHMARYEHLRQGPVKKLMTRVGLHNLRDLIDLMQADIIGSKPPYNFKGIVDLDREIHRIIDYKEPMKVTDLEINGKDLINLGMTPGPKMGELLNKMLDAVIEDPELNNHISLKVFAEEYLSDNSNQYGASTAAG